MSVLIRGMELPSSCYDCNCFICDSDGSDYCCLLMQDIVDNNKRDDDCPIIPAPPHGRWIVDDITGLVKCSECENDAPLDTTGGGQWLSVFCPSCGALMDKDGDGE